MTPLVTTISEILSNYSISSLSLFESIKLLLVGIVFMLAAIIIVASIWADFLSFIGKSKEKRIDRRNKYVKDRRLNK